VQVLLGEKLTVLPSLNAATSTRRWGMGRYLRGTLGRVGDGGGVGQLPTCVRGDVLNGGINLAFRPGRERDNSVLRLVNNYKNKNTDAS
jgi:hypothetical protein